jgi:hypothetical protein
MTKSIQDIEDHLAVLGKTFGPKRDTFPGFETDIFSVRDLTEAGYESAFRAMMQEFSAEETGVVRDPLAPRYGSHCTDTAL